MNRRHENRSNWCRGKGELAGGRGLREGRGKVEGEGGWWQGGTGGNMFKVHYMPAWKWPYITKHDTLAFKYSFFPFSLVSITSSGQEGVTLIDRPSMHWGLIANSTLRTTIITLGNCLHGWCFNRNWARLSQIGKYIDRGSIPFKLPTIIETTWDGKTPNSDQFLNMHTWTEIPRT